MQSAINRLEKVLPSKEVLIGLFNIYITGDRTDEFQEVDLNEVSFVEEIFQQVMSFVEQFSPVSNQMILEKLVMLSFMMVSMLHINSDIIPSLEIIEYRSDFQEMIGCPPFYEEELLTLIDGFEQSFLEMPDEIMNERYEYVKGEWNAAMDRYSAKESIWRKPVTVANLQKELKLTEPQAIELMDHIEKAKTIDQVKNVLEIANKMIKGDRVARMSSRYAKASGEVNDDIAYFVQLTVSRSRQEIARISDAETLLYDIHNAKFIIIRPYRFFNDWGRNYGSPRTRNLTDYIQFIELFLEDYEKRDPFYYFYALLLTVCYLHTMSRVLFQEIKEEYIY
jgi:hypothetical protein